MTIQIIKVTITNDPFTGQPTGRSAEFIISNGGGTIYRWSAGAIPLTGSVQAFLDAEEADLWAGASTNGQLATAAEIEIAGARAYYVANLGMKTAVFDKTVAQSDIDITALCNAITGLSAAQKTGLKQLLISALLDTRVNAHDRDLV